MCAIRNSLWEFPLSQVPFLGRPFTFKTNNFTSMLWVMWWRDFEIFWDFYVSTPLPGRFYISLWRDVCFYVCLQDKITSVENKHTFIHWFNHWLIQSLIDWLIDWYDVLLTEATLIHRRRSEPQAVGQTFPHVSRNLVQGLHRPSGDGHRLSHTAAGQLLHLLWKRFTIISISFHPSSNSVSRTTTPDPSPGSQATSNKLQGCFFPPRYFWFIHWIIRALLFINGSFHSVMESQIFQIHPSFGNCLCPPPPPLLP